MSLHIINQQFFFFIHLWSRLRDWTGKIKQVLAHCTFHCSRKTKEWEKSKGQKTLVVDLTNNEIRSTQKEAGVSYLSNFLQKFQNFWWRRQPFSWIKKFWYGTLKTVSTHNFKFQFWFKTILTQNMCDDDIKTSACEEFRFAWKTSTNTNTFRWCFSEWKELKREKKGEAEKWFRVFG